MIRCRQFVKDFKAICLTSHQFANRDGRCGRWLYSVRGGLSWSCLRMQCVQSIHKRIEVLLIIGKQVAFAQVRLTDRAGF